MAAELGEFIAGRFGLVNYPVADCGTIGRLKFLLFIRVALAGDLSLPPPDRDSYLFIFKLASFLFVLMFSWREDVDSYL